MLTVISMLFEVR